MSLAAHEGIFFGGEMDPFVKVFILKNSLFFCVKHDSSYEESLNHLGTIFIFRAFPPKVFESYENLKMKVIRPDEITCREFNINHDDLILTFDESTSTILKDFSPSELFKQMVSSTSWIEKDTAAFTDIEMSPSGEILSIFSPSPINQHTAKGFSTFQKLIGIL